ncbi:MAG: PEP-CTERM sorting domain-containing protein [Phycisphaerae bacterium]|nr:PEP-CTERM sorting domain-containing protein [Phycisphaerae bacterium]
MHTGFRRAFAGIACVTTVALASQANAAEFLFQLRNHPDGQVQMPQYGARLDELFNATSGTDIFTFDFNHAQSDMKLIYDSTAATIRIFGQSWGGRDTGSSYANDIYRGVYQFDFLYAFGVGQVPGDDDLWASPAQDFLNKGTVSAPVSAGGQTFHLVDKGLGMFGYTFRFGDENNDLGHRGYNGISGWGWMEINDAMNGNATRDWLFTAVPVPEPTTAMFAMFGVAALLRRRSR